MRTAIYPAHARVQYPALKLAGEVGEAAGKLVALRNAERNHGDASAERAALHAELGDVLWYVAALARDLELRDPWLDEPLERLHARGVTMWPHRNDARQDRLALTLMLLVASGTEAAERYGKLIRDVPDFDPQHLSDDARDLLGRIVYRTLTLVAATAAAAGTDLATLTRDNVAKLASRHQRGVINGSGDTR